VDRARIKVVDAGEVILVIEPLSEPQPGERWMLRVPLADGKEPEVAEFALAALYMGAELAVRCTTRIRARTSTGAPWASSTAM
jgi:hypothetical protein